MKRILILLMTITLGITLGIFHIRSAEQTVPWYIANKPEPEVIQIKVEPIPMMDEVEEIEMHLINVADIDPEIPEEIQRAAEFYGSEYNICPELLESMAWQESRYQPNVKSKDGSCIGLMQIKASCHKSRMERLGVSKEELTEVYPNMKVAADYLHELFEQYEDPAVVLMAYNGDQRYLSGKVSYYAQSILDRSYELEIRHGKGEQKEEP